MSGGVVSIQARLPVVIALWLAVLMSAVGVIYSTHLARKSFHELEKLKRQENFLQVEWGQLLLEKSVWSAQVRVERIAAQRLNMMAPDPNTVTMVRP